jgi:hypothetical protein
MRIFYCIRKECRKAIEVTDAVPTRCPHCKLGGAFTTDVPTLDSQLTEDDRDYLLTEKIACKVGH